MSGTLTPTGLLMGWSGVQVTPNGGAAIPIPDVVSAQPTRKGTEKKFYGDCNVFPRLTVSREKTRTCQISTGSITQLAKIPEGVPCTVVAVFNDPINGDAVGGGALKYTLTNAVCIDNGAKGDANEFGIATASFSAFSPDGTDPLTITPL